jgi:Ni/Fe-hydrogenase subunit HybB-like protein
VNGTTNVRLMVTRLLLWAFVGAGTAVAVLRFVRGLGVTTALTDLTPWGLWIGFDVVSGVALAAGGFVIAATVHVVHLERYHGVLRPAILTAFLGYTAVVLGLLVDLGRPWNIWRMTIYWNPHSPLFEVGWCVMLYLSVLTLEFAPVVVEGLRWSRAYRFLRRLTLPLVVVGIALSTLHQSSLGTLFLINPGRIHPLWYSPLLPLLFFISAVALGLAMVTVESLVSSWLFRRDPEWPLLPGLTRAASWVLGAYFVLRLGDLAWRGQLRHAVEGSWAAALFIVEVLVSVIVPELLFNLPSTRRNRRALATGASMVVAGFVLNRATVAGIADVPMTGSSYVPALSEIAVSLSIVAAMALVFLFFVERLKVWEEPPERADHFRTAIVEPASTVRIRAPWLGGAQRAGLGWVAGVLVALAMFEMGSANGAEPRPTPVQGPEAVRVVRITAPGGAAHRFVLATSTVPNSATVETALIIDGDRDGRFTVFEHARHQQRLGGVASCELCHHLNAPLERGTSCARCHRDMYRTTDTFDHQRHAVALGGNTGCLRCHPAGAAKTRAASTPCDDCHARDRSTTAVLATGDKLPPGIAPGYKEAMHGLCITCHARHEAAAQLQPPTLSRCPNCHRARTDDGWDLRVREGWVVSAAVRP